MIKNMKIGLKLNIFVGLMIAFVAVTEGILSYYETKISLEYEVKHELEAILESRYDALHTDLDTIKQELILVADNPNTIAAFEAFDEAWEYVPGNRIETLHKLYIEDNPNPTGEKDKLNQAPGDLMYNAVHAQYHPWFRELLVKRGYYDIFFFNPNGDLVYSVFKELDYAQNFVTGPYKDSGLAAVFTGASVVNDPDKLTFDDYRPYAPSNGAPAAFVARKIVDANGKNLGVLAFQMPIARINKHLAQYAGMGELGESYLVGTDHLMRSASRFDENSILTQVIETDSVERGLAGEESIITNQSYTGYETVAGFMPVDFLGTRWVLVVELASHEVFEPLNTVIRDIAMLVVVMLILSLVITYLASRTLTVPITRMTSALTSLAEGKLETNIEGLDRRDEVGEMAQAAQVFKENIAENVRVAAERAEEQKLSLEQQRKQSLEMADLLESSVLSVVEGVQGQTSTVNDSLAELADDAEQSNRLSQTARGRSEEVNGKMQTIASATEELAASIQEINNQAVQASKVTAEAVSEANESSQQVEGLLEAADQIGEIISLIENIAAQTNLLALNATIEAARAGEAGKGFAVVASEVKALANQTAKATEQISSQIGEIREATTQASKAITKISTAVSSVGEVTEAITQSVEQQDSATREIASNVQEVASDSNSMSEEILDISNSSQKAGTMTRSSLGCVQELAASSKELQTKVREYLQTLRQSKAGNRRADDRYPANGMNITVIHEGSEYSVELMDLSKSGARIVVRCADGQCLHEKLSIGEYVTFRFMEGCELQGAVIRLDDKGFAVDQFEMNEEKLQDILTRLGHPARLEEVA
ncbi:methyl-accepting chemotaxis protein [Kiloniella sp. b19]|uniref:methyl-accepting chemotaxis protein n=1 Tax=Kiloniella sp. GXU_MW_B19 TaxID=3141326 RepID=UPI0031E41EA5